METKLVDLSLGPTEQGAIHAVENNFWRGPVCWGEKERDQLLLGHDTPPQVRVNPKGVSPHFPLPMFGRPGM